MPQILALFAGHGLKFALVFGMIAMIGTWDFRRIKAAEKRGGDAVRVETKKANDAVVNASDRVRRKVKSDNVKGIRDPNSVD